MRVWRTNPPPATNFSPIWTLRAKPVSVLSSFISTSACRKLRDFQQIVTANNAAANLAGDGGWIHSTPRDGFVEPRRRWHRLL
jgi:hypothetical protein